MNLKKKTFSDTWECTNLFRFHERTVDRGRTKELQSEDCSFHCLKLKNTNQTVSHLLNILEVYNKGSQRVKCEIAGAVCQIT